MATIGGIDPTFTGTAKSSEPPYVRLPAPQQLFERRAGRFRVVAAGSPIAGYLGFLAELAEAQHRAAQASSPPVLPDTVAQSIANGMPPLPRDLAGDPGALALFKALVADLAGRELPEGPAAIVRALAALDDDGCRSLLAGVADGVFEIERLGESAVAGAALQVWFASAAAQLDPAALRNIGEAVCPCCGGAPVSSTVVGWPDAQGSRYLSCALCCTMWNHVRIKCTACGSTKGISYRSVEGSTGDIAAEVCESCGGYAKHLAQIKNAALEPLVDDVASYGLDMMLRDDGWRRTGLNPFLILPG